MVNVFLAYSDFIFYFCKNIGLHTMTDRLLKFMAAENISQSQLADTLGASRASLSHILSGRNKPGYDFFESLSRNYPALSLEWLITGRGKMYRTAHDEPGSESASGLMPVFEARRQEIERIVVFFDDGTYREFK